MRRALLILVTFTVLAALAPGELAWARAAEPWATVNVCDTETSQNQIGIRGSMPGMARKTRMLMRFRVQYKDAQDRWQTVTSGADSGWRTVATARRGEHDAGWTFEFQPRASGGAWELRGVVSFKWRRGDRVVQRDRRITEDGHPGTAGAEPADYSAATCAIA
jgi:hypothetical protein